MKFRIINISLLLLIFLTGIGCNSSKKNNPLWLLLGNLSENVSSNSGDGSGTGGDNGSGGNGSNFTPAIGKLDNNFGDGKVMTPIGTGDDEAYAIAIQSDGKIVVAGYSYNGTNYDIAVVRYNTDGSLDTSFGSGGKVTTPIGTGDDGAYAIAIQSDGKIVVAGNYSNGSYSDIAVVRYNTNGSLDTSFGSGGKVTTSIGTSDDFAFAIAIQSDGKIVVAGYYWNGSNNDFAVVRYNTNGSLDTSFDSDGKVTTPIGSTDRGYAIAIQSDGKIVVGGYSVGTNYGFAVVRYNTNGSLDTSFGSGGKVTTSIGTGNEEAYAIAIQSDGKIVVAGYSYNGTTNDFAVVRYNTDGSLDTSFDNDGKVTTPIGSNSDIGRAIAIQSDGKIVVAGFSSSGSYDFVVVRYNTDGSLDNNFGDGKVITQFGFGLWDDFAHAMAVQSDGKIVVAGYYWNGSNNDFAVVRYNTNGSLDTSFGSGGKVTTSIGTGDDGAYAIAIQSDGKIVVAGYYWNGSNSDFAVVRYNTDGSLDSNFDGDGKVTTSIGTSDDFAFAIAIQSDGKIVVAGYYWNGSNDDFAVVRYNTNGSLDTSFDSDGKVMTPIGSTDRGYAIAIQSDGKIVVAGYSVGTNYGFAVVRYNTNGSLDTSFGSGGKVTTSIGTGNEEAYAIAIQSDGKIVVAGYSYNGSNADFAVVRYNIDGSLDTSFDGDGKVTTSIGTGDDGAYAIAIQPDGKIVIVGFASSGSNYDFAVVRYNIDGSLDSSFDVDGKVTTDINTISGDERARAIAIQSDGKIVVAGYSHNGSNKDITVVRYK